MARKKRCPRKSRVGGGAKEKYKHNKNPKQPGQWVDFIRKNESFEEYYKAQQIVPEEEFPLFLSAMQQELPSSFRITGTRSHAQKLLQAMQKFFLGKLENVESDGETVDPLRPIEWYPDNLAWQVNFTKKFIRKSSCLSKFHRFLVLETESGNISRQEAVSMIPPLLLDVKPGQKIFDACAAPGSKTVQLIELLHNDETSGIPDGLVVANEIQNKRCYMLVHQSKRLSSPCCVITNHDAAAFPTLFTKQDDGDKKPLQFDRILCDVPCSGDGTLRKNPQIWKKWTPQLGTGLFRIQLRILARAVEMLTTGGRIVYSTCTLNPVEDEAVISTLLQKAEGALELVDVSSCLPNLKRSPGLTTWKVMTKGMKVVDHCGPQSEFFSKGFKPDMLAPPEEVAKKLHLERCIRIYPHQQDTGGFFIAVLEKKHPAHWENEKRYSDNPKLLPWQSEPDYQWKHSQKIRKRKAGETTSDGGNETSGIEDNQGDVRIGVDAESENNLAEAVGSQTEGATTTESEDQVMQLDIEVKSSSTHCNVDHVDDNDKEEDGASGMQTSNAEQLHEHCVEDVEGHEENCDFNELDELGETNECAADEEFDDRPIQSCSKDNDGSSEGNAVDSTSQEENIGQPPRKKPKLDRGYKEDPYVFLKEGDQDWCHISRFYGIDDSFPSTQLLVRSEEGKKRNIYLVSKAVRDVMEMLDDRIKVINTGIKVIARAEADGVGCCFRLLQEGIEVLLSFIGKRKVSISQKDAMILLTHDRPFFNELSSTTREQFDKIEGNLFDEESILSVVGQHIVIEINQPPFTFSVVNLELYMAVHCTTNYIFFHLHNDINEGAGCIVYLYEPDGPHSKPADTISCKMVFVGWKARVSTRLQVNKYHKFHYLALCGIPSDSGEKVRPQAMGNETESRTGADGDNGVKEDESETVDEELTGFVGDILNVNAPEGALDVGFI